MTDAPQRYDCPVCGHKQAGFLHCPLHEAGPDLVAALEAIEWDRDDQCLWCKNFFKEGHKSDCQRQQALAAVAGESAK